MKKLASITCIILILVSIIPILASASESELEEIIYFEDSSYIVVTIEEFGTRASGTKSGSKIYNYYNNANSLMWSATLSGTFAYDGNSAVCTASNCNISISDNSWYTASKGTTKQGNKAITEFTMGRKVLGVTVEKKTVNMTLACDANGNLS